jgi:manganese efflux pump family protein
LDLFTTLGLALGLSMDATAVAVAVSVALGRVSGAQVFRFAFHFGLFQAVMPLIGWAAGRSFMVYIQAWDHWVAFGLLLAVGGKALFEAFAAEGAGQQGAADPTRGWSLIFLSTATSIDALAVGLSFAMLDTPVVEPCAIIGLVTAALTVVGMLVGGRIGARFGQRMRVVGGLVLIAIGLKILFEHLTA